ncbi:MAG TPA: CPBP family glutamic-type intramembrane protease [Polyangiaceae bacterium]|nr:CPBP family glutamic-type intramembrane protease [Polyangiaceae bacterium]
MAKPVAAETEAQRFLREGSGPWADLALTLPVFVGYHLGVVFLPVRNAADIVTRELTTLAENSIWQYIGLTLGIGAAFASVLLMLGRGHTLRSSRFVFVAIEGILYAIAMRLAGQYVVSQLALVGGMPEGHFSALVMSLGAGFYEEIAFRVVLFGLGLRLILGLIGSLSHVKRLLVALGWALAIAVVFSGWHYVGDLGEPFDLRSFVFRTVCGLAFTAIYSFRGFAPAVWTHTIYDAWVLLF